MTGTSCLSRCIPDANAIAIRVNGEWADGILADIQQFPHSVRMTEAENSATKYAFSNDLGFTVARASDRIAAFANSTGDMQIQVRQCQGRPDSAEFPFDSYYYGNFTPPGAPDTEECFVYDRCGVWVDSATHADPTSVSWGSITQWVIDNNPAGVQQVMAAQGPLTVHVNAYVNGEWVQGQTIFESTDVTVVPGDFLDRRLVYQYNGGLEYGMEDDDATMRVPVQAGDFVEFVVSSRTMAASTPVYAGSGTSADVWWGNSTSRIHNGLMLVSMP